MSAPSCHSCKHNPAGQCELEWPDRSFSDALVTRKIVVVSTAHESGAEHVYRFWCRGEKFEAKRSWFG